MINRLMEKKRQDEGFTLIELLIVVIILGILAAVVVFGVSTFSDDSNTEACRTDVKSVETAAEAYKAKNGSYPADPAGDDTPMDVLLDADYLKDAPGGGDYTITLGNGDGVVTSNPADCVFT